jgi:hypothetical protein
MAGYGTRDEEGSSVLFSVVKEHMARSYSLESATRPEFAQVGFCSLDELTALLPGYSWAQVFSAVDRLTRNGTMALTHPVPFRYLLSPRHDT